MMRLDGVRANADDLVQTLVDYARKGNRESFFDLARMSGIDDPEPLWKGTRYRLHLPDIDTTPVDRNIDPHPVSIDAVIEEIRAVTIPTATDTTTARDMLATLARLAEHWRALTDVCDQADRLRDLSGQVRTPTLHAVLDIALEEPDPPE